MHLVYPPKFYITIVSNFSLELKSSHEKAKEIVMIFFFFSGVGGSGG